MPRLLFATSQMAMNQPVRGRCVLSIIVPFVTENCLEHLVHCHLWAWPLTCVLSTRREQKGVVPEIRTKR
jgi:hypothetical protein